MATAMGGLKLWTARKVPFIFEDGYPYEGDVLSAMNTIESSTRIWFCKRGNEANYVLIRNLGQNSSSDVGMKGGKQECNVTAGYKALHELGHTLGLIHEQVRTDRDNYIEIHWENITDDRSNSNSSCLPKGSTYQNTQFAIDNKSRSLTDYDMASVMHYPAPATGWQGCPPDQEVWTMRWKKNPAQRLGGQVNGKDADGWKVLTKLDVEGLNTLYDDIPGWSKGQTVPDAGTTDSPALAVFQNRLYLAWKGHSDQHVWWNSFDGGQRWAGQQQVPDVGTTSAPALAVFQDRLYLAWKGSSDQHIWLNSSPDGSQWKGQQQVPDVGTTDGPALTVFQNRLYLAWKGSSDQHVWLNSSSDGSQWAGQQQVPDVGTTDSPALAVFKDRLYLAWKGSSDQHIWWNSSSDGSHWAGQQQVPNAGTTDNPALAVFKDKLYLVWKGSGDRHIWYADFDGSANPWSGQARIAGFDTSNGPALAAGFPNKLFMIWKNSGDQHLSYGDFTL